MHSWPGYGSKLRIFKHYGRINISGFAAPHCLFLYERSSKLPINPAGKKSAVKISAPSSRSLKSLLKTSTNARPSSCELLRCKAAKPRSHEAAAKLPRSCCGYREVAKAAKPNKDLMLRDTRNQGSVRCPQEILFS